MRHDCGSEFLESVAALPAAKQESFVILLRLAFEPIRFSDRYAKLPTASKTVSAPHFLTRFTGRKH